MDGTIKMRFWARKAQKMSPPIPFGSMIVAWVEETQGALKLLMLRPMVDDMIEMLWTGMRDSHNKDIYVGDIVGWGKDQKGEVKFEKGKFYVDGYWASWQDNPTDAFAENVALHILGNKFENPELL